MFLVKVHAPENAWGDPYVIPGVAVLYSRDNGITFTRYEHETLYEVPFHVARGMVQRGWARIERPPYHANGQPRPPQDEPSPMPPTPIQEPEETEKPKPDRNGGDEEEALRARAEVKHGRPNL